MNDTKCANCPNATPFSEDWRTLKDAFARRPYDLKTDRFLPAAHDDIEGQKWDQLVAEGNRLWLTLRDEDQPYGWPEIDA